LWRYRRCISHTCACIQRCGSPRSIPSSGSSTTAQRTSAVSSQLLKSPHSKRPVLRAYPSSPVGIQLFRSLETRRTNSQAVLMSRSRYHHRLPRRMYGGDVFSPVGLVGITLSASVARKEWSLSGGPVNFDGKPKLVRQPSSPCCIYGRFVNRNPLTVTCSLAGQLLVNYLLNSLTGMQETFKFTT
jgi:hypothetical protein